MNDPSIGPYRENDLQGQRQDDSLRLEIGAIFEVLNLIAKRLEEINHTLKVMKIPQDNA